MRNPFTHDPDWLTSSLVGVAIGIATVSVFLLVVTTAVSMSARSPAPASYLVSTFGFTNALFLIFISFYIRFGPRLNIPLTPKQEMPARASVILFTMGAGLALISLRFLSGTGSPATLFWRVVGYTIFSVLGTGLMVSYLTRYSPSDEPPVELPDDDP